MSLGMSDTWAVPKIWKKIAKDIGAPDVSKMKEMTGQQLLNLKRDITNAIGDLGKKDWRKMSQLQKFGDEVDNVITANVNPSGKATSEFASDWAKFKAMAPNYKKYQDVVGASRKSLNKASEYSPKDLLGVTNARAGKSGVQGGGALNYEAKNATAALEDFPSKEGIDRKSTR